MKPNRNLYNKPRKLFTAQSTHKFLVLFLFTVFIYLNFTSCNTTEPPKPKPEKPKLIELKEITKSCTETFIKVSTKDTLLPTNVVLQRDGKEIMSFYQTKRDTTLIDTGLAVEQTYTYQAIIKNKGEEGKSKEIEISTLPTTSSNFTWEKYTFGEHSSSIIRDVAIINENDIWAVGEIYMNDSTGKADLLPYNAVHWNGQKWELMRIKYKGLFWPISTIYAFDSNDIWFSAFEKYNGTDFIDLPIPDILKGWTVNRLWGTSSNDIYAVGTNGNIVHYDGTNWEKIESGTNLNIIDIWGDKNTFTDKTEIICGAYNQIPRSETDIIRINSDNTTEKLSQIGLGQSYAAVYFKAGLRYYLVGDGLYEKTFKDSTRWFNLNSNRKITSNFMNAIRGNGLNNIIAVGAYGEVLLYNGIRWKSLKNDETSLSNGSYYSVAVKNRTVVAVGFDAAKVIILMGRRD